MLTSNRLSHSFFPSHITTSEQCLFWQSILTITLEPSCREPHPQYCHFIEELNEDNLADGVKEDNKLEAFAKGNNDEMKCNVDDDDDDNFFDVQEEEVE